MGLAIKHTIIEAHVGRIQADNNADVGAIVSFSLPIIFITIQGDIPMSVKAGAITLQTNRTSPPLRGPEDPRLVTPLNMY